MLINGSNLGIDDFAELTELFSNIFNPGEFLTMLRKRMGWNTIGINADEKTFTEMLDRAEKSEETQELLEAALKEKPRSQRLKDFAQRIGFFALASPLRDAFIPPQTGMPTRELVHNFIPSQTTTSAQISREVLEENLERKVNALGTSLKPKQWRARMAQRERQICRIVIEGWEEAYGTGFLVNSDVVMTNYHVLQNVIDGDGVGTIPSSRVSLYFDYELKEDGETFEKASEHHLVDEGWRLDHSEYSDSDKQYSPHCVDIDERRLDFVLLRLREQAGEECIDGKKRGWIEMSEVEYPFKTETPILILHHPNGDDLTFDWDTRSVLETNQRKTRVRYSTATESGSSGAPCFTVNWELIAIHQSGDPNFTHSAEYNQGIPIFTILQRLKKYGTDKYLAARKDEDREDREASANLSSGENQKNLMHILHGKEVEASVDLSRVQIEEPESKFPVEEQLLLISLFKKEELSLCISSGTKSLSITREMMEEHIDTEMLSAHFCVLVKGYAKVIILLMEEVKKPFASSADIRPIHLGQVDRQFELIGDCLRKICFFVKRAIPPLETDLVNRVTMEADNLLKEKDGIRELVVDEKKEYDSKMSDRMKKRFKNILVGFENMLNEFFRTLPEG